MKIIACFLFTFFFLQSNAQDWFIGTSSNFTNEALDVKLDSHGNSISTGYLSGHTNFEDNFLVSNNGNSDVYVSKMDALGQIVWTQKFGGTQPDRGVKVAIDNQNNILVTGSFFGNMNVGTFNLQSSNNSKDIFLAKFDPNGTVLWARKEGGNYGENAYDIAIDAQDNVVLTGQFEGVSTIGNTTFTSQINPFTNAFSFDLFLSKYDSNGNPLWAKKANSEYEDRGMAVTCDATNNIYLTGQFSDTLNFLGTTFNNQIYNSAFISKINPAGEMVYFKKYAGAMALPYDIELNEANEIYITGDFLGNLLYFDSDLISQLTNPYSRKIFVLKLSNNGNYIWGKAQGSNSDVSSRAITIDANQDIYIAGNFSCNFDQYRDSSFKTGLWNSVGFKDVFVSKFSPAGTMLWNKQNGGKKDDICYGIDIDDLDRPVYAGSFENNFIVPTQMPNTPDFDTSSVLQYHTTWPQVYDNNGIITTYGNRANPLNFKYYLLVGDDTKNSFVGKVVHGDNPAYYYYKSSAISKPFVSPDLMPNVAIYETCLKDSILFDHKTDPELGPGYSVLWNGNPDPDGNYFHNLTQEETIILNADRWNNCSSFDDQIQIILHDQFPVKLTDNRGFNNLQLPQYDSIFLCFPDVAIVTPTDLCAGCTFKVSRVELINVVHTGFTPFIVNSSSRYLTQVTNQYGCVKIDTLDVFVINNQPYDLIDPELVLIDSIDYNDSLKICFGDTVSFFITDKLTNLDLGFDSTYYETFSGETFTELNFGEQIFKSPKWLGYRFHRASMIPDSTGWYVIKYDYTLGYNNFCGVDTTEMFTYIDSFYLEVQPLPEVNIILSDQGIICPGEINTITVVPNVNNFDWIGPGITWQSSDRDSIQVTTGGLYTYKGLLVNEENGCSVVKEFQINVLEKSPPQLFTNPTDGVICPNATVDIWIDKAGNYEWFGVNGVEIGSDSLIEVENQGFYYCIYTDPEGCTMVTQQVEIREYTSPTIYVYPDNILCQNETTTINAISFGISTVNWTSPLNSSATTLDVSQPGVYVCEISQCGITVKDSVTIIDGSFDLSISASQTTLCYGDTAILTANSGFDLYLWNDLFFDDDTLEIFSAGDYSVSATNEFGCIQTSEIFTINQFPVSILPPIPDTNICPGASITLTHNSPFQLTWYEDELATIPIIQGTTISFTTVLQDTFVYAAYASTNCPLAVAPVKINVIEPLLPPLLLGDTTICIGDSLYFETPANDSLTYQWFLDGDLISTEFSTNNLDSVSIFLDSAAEIMLIVTDFCSTNRDSTNIEIIYKNDMSLNLDTELLCPQDPLLLFDIPDFVNGVLWVNGSQDSISDSLLIFLNQLDTTFIFGYGIDEYGCFSRADTVHFIIPNLTYLNISQLGLDCFDYSIKLVGNSDVENLTWTLPSQITDVSDTIFIPEMNQNFVGQYNIQAIDDQFGCIMNDSVTLFNHDLPVFDVASDTALCYYYSLNYVSPNLPYNFYWNGIDTNFYQPTETQEINVLAVSDFGCEFTDSFFVYFSDCDPTGTNVITPNGDGINDFLIIDDAKLLFDNCIIVLNRWGNVVYEEKYYQNTFNGYTNENKKLNDGVYYYLFYSICGDKKAITFQGYFHILTEK